MQDSDYELRSLEAVAKAGNLMASQFKEFGAAEIDPHFDIPPFLVGFRGTGEHRGGEERHGVLVEVICGEVNRDEGLQAAYALAAMDCIAVAVTFDAHMTSAEVNPRTGKPWGPGEMQGLCDGEGACDTGLLTDCLTTTAVFATGKVAGYNHSYHVHEGKREIAWVNDGEGIGDGDDGVKLGGYVVDTLKRVMVEGRTRSALLMSGAAAKLAGVQMPVEARAHRDAALLGMLAENGGLIRVAPAMAENKRERAIIQRVMDKHKNVVWFE